MPVLIQFDFPYQGPFGAEMSSALGELAGSITKEPGFVWKIWTENASTLEAGGVYLFEDAKSAAAYVAKHTERLKQFGITQINVKIFDVNLGLSRITRGPLTSS
jgi:hypothetical protein